MIRPTHRMLAGVGAVAMAVTVGLATAAAAASGFVSDDFFESTLDSRWQVVRPLGVGSVDLQGSGTTDAYLALSVPAGTNHDPWVSHDGVRAVQPVSDTDMRIEARFDSVPGQRYQMQGLSFEQDSGTFGRFEVHHNGNGLRLFASTTVNGSPTSRISKSLPALSRVWLRVTRTGATWTLTWSADGTSWSTGGSFTETFTVARVGPFVGNYDRYGNPPAYTALVDYVFDADAPISPEDSEETTSPSPSPTASPSPSPTASPSPSPSPDDGSGGPVIHVWYGSSQTVGPVQTWANVVGRVTDPDGVSSLSYRLNGGAARNLSIGPDNRRLQDPGDFNADISYTDLVPGANTVQLTAVDGAGEASSTTVTVNRDDTATPILPHTVDWTAGQPLHSQAQPVDGLWSVSSGDLRTQITGYDRIVALGDHGWRDYDVTVPITVHAFGDGAYSHLSGAPLIGLGMRWQGHTAVDGTQPAWGWYPVGAYAWYRFYSSGGKFELTGNEGSPAKYPRPTFELGVTYQLKVRAQTTTGATRYSVKIWPAGTTEPSGWLAYIDEIDGPATGSVALIAHQLDATFGTVTVTGI